MGSPWRQSWGRSGGRSGRWGEGGSDDRPRPGGGLRGPDPGRCPGCSHWQCPRFYTDTPKLDFERLAAINEAVSIPLVLHGGTGIPDDDLRRAIELGIRKVNIGTEVMTAFGTTLREALKNTEGPIVGLAELAQAKRAMQEKIQARMRVLGSSGKA